MSVNSPRGTNAPHTMRGSERRPATAARPALVTILRAWPAGAALALGLVLAVPRAYAQPRATPLVRAPQSVRVRAARAALQGTSDVFTTYRFAAPAPSLATRPTSLAGAIDVAVLERLIRSRLREVESDALRDALTGDLASLRRCAPLIDIVESIAGIAVQVADGDTRSLSLTAGILRDGFSFALAAMAAPADPRRPGTGIIPNLGCGTTADTAGLTARANAAYLGLSQSTYLRALGFPRADCSQGVDPGQPTGGGSAPPAVCPDPPTPECRDFADEVKKLANTLARLTLNAASIQGVVTQAGQVRAGCLDAVGAPVGVRAELVDLRAALTYLHAHPISAAGLDVTGLRELRNAFARARGEFASAPAAGDTTACVQSLQSFTTAFDNALGRLAPDTNDVVTLQSLLDTLASLGDPATLPNANATFTALGAAPEGIRTAVRTAAALASTGDITLAIETLARRLAAATAARLATENACGGRAHELAIDADGFAATVRELLAGQRTGLDRLHAAAPPAPVPHPDTCTPAVHDLAASLDELAGAYRAVEPAALTTANPPADLGGLEALGPQLQAVRGLAGDLQSTFASLRDDPDVALLQAIATRLADGQALRRGDLVSLAARIKIHVDTLVPAGPLRTLLDAVLDDLPQSIREDDHAPGGLRLDVAALVTRLATQFSQNDREGFYLRATVGAGYLYQSSGDINPSYYEELGGGYRFGFCGRRFLTGPHAMVSGLLYQIEHAGNAQNPLFAGLGWSVNLYRLIDISANAGVMVDLARSNHAPPAFAMLVGLQLPLSDYLSALTSSSSASTTTTTTGNNQGGTP
jgi:hypothetical protein